MAFEEIKQVVLQSGFKCVHSVLEKMSLTCRVQYLNDIDPFAYTTNYPDPARPPSHTFSVTLPLINQLAAIHRLLKSPHRVSPLYIF